MKDPSARPVLIRPDDVPIVYGFSRRQIKRWLVEGKIRRVKPSGPTGPCYLLVADLDQLIEDSIVPAGQKAGRKPPKSL